METIPGSRGVPEPTRDVPVAVVAALIVLILGLLGARQSQLLSRAQRQAESQHVLAHLTAGVATDLTSALERTTLAAAGIATDRPPGADRFGVVPVDPAAPSQRSPLTAAERGLPEVESFLEQVRDSGSPQLSPPVELSSGTRVLAAAPLYGPGAQPGRPVTPDDRRARLRGWHLATLDFTALSERHLVEEGVAAFRDGAELVASVGAVHAGLPEVDVDVAGRRYDISAGLAGDASLGTATVGLALVAVLGAPLAALLTLLGGRRVRRLRKEFVRREAQVRLIGEVAPLVQQSLELYDVLPAVAVQLTDHFELTGVRLCSGEGAEQRELFSLGERPDPTSRPVLRPPHHLAAGETLSLGLQRGGRSVAILQLVSGRNLDEADLESLRALSELVAAAIVNASLYARQQQAMRRLQELDTMKTVFLSTASHELRTPATAIAGFAGILADSWDRFDDEQRKEFARRIAANASSLGNVVEDLLDFSLLDRGEAPLATEPIDLGELVTSVADRLTPVLEGHTLLHTRLDAPPIAAEVNALERIVTNLLTNAAKFSPHGSTISVTVGPDPDRGGAALVIADQGPGVPEDDRQRVFTRFFRGTGDAVVQTRGVGIGLSVVAELVTRMHGTVELDDAPGGGARFTVRLPAATVTSLEEEVADASPA